MLKRISLRTRILVIVSVMVLITVGGGLISIWHARMVQGFFDALVETDLQALQVSRELEKSLVMQKGYVTYYYQDSDPAWLEELNKHHRAFENWLEKVRNWVASHDERQIVNEIESKYIRYVNAREDVINLYLSGKKEDGLKLQKNVREQMFQLFSLCSQLMTSLENGIERARQANRDRMRMINTLAMLALCSAVVLGAILVYVLIKDVLGPIRELAIGTASSKAADIVENEVKALGRRFRTLMKDIDQTRTKLKWSREHLEQAEKWALVGKLAAGVAHSVRNPLTSVKMRLFSMERTLALTLSQKEDFEVISEEIRHIDTIVNNFLEFSRPPKLKMQKVSPSDAVDLAVQLLKHRLESYMVKVELLRDGRLPEVLADIDQLKEVLVNLMVNACEAMVNGGCIWIEESTNVLEGQGKVVQIKVRDNGPGVPESIQDRLFQPFFSTKEEGTGLGLSIASRIVDEHGGWLDLESKEGQGATFVIALRVIEEGAWAQS
jgi:signal transduction histidine kinase